MLFNPPLLSPRQVGRDELGVHHLVYNSISKADIDMRQELYGNIVLSGGTTMFRGTTASASLA